MREKGLVLTGPDPRELIDPVSPTALRAEVRETIDRCLSTGLPIPMIAWQAFWVGLYCRMLHTLATGEVTSKKQAMSWALKVLDPQWHGLITRAKMLKKGDEAHSSLPADPIEAEATCKFAAYSIAFADQSGLV